MSVSVHSVQTGRISVSSSNIRSGSLFIYLQASRVGTQTSAHRLPRSSGKEAKKCAKLVAHCSQPRAAADDSNLCSTTTECPKKIETSGTNKWLSSDHQVGHSSCSCRKPLLGSVKFQRHYCGSRRKARTSNSVIVNWTLYIILSQTRHTVSLLAWFRSQVMH